MAYIIKKQIATRCKLSEFIIFVLLSVGMPLSGQWLNMH